MQKEEEEKNTATKSQEELSPSVSSLPAAPAPSPPPRRSFHICFPCRVCVYSFCSNSFPFPSSLLSPLPFFSEPLAGAFNRLWHLSPRAVMFLIHQWGMAGWMPPLEPGEKGSHSTGPQRLEGVGAAETDTHGHWNWTFNH